MWSYSQYTMDQMNKTSKDLPYILFKNECNTKAVYGMTREGEGLGTLERFVNKWGAPDAIRRDNSKMQNSVGWKKFEQKMQIKCELTEPYNQQMNPAERRIQTAKSNTNKLMDRTGTPKFMWLHCMIYAVAILNMACMDRLQGRNAHEVAFGHSLDISAYIQYSWWEKVYFLDTEDPSFPRSKEKLGHFCGVAENVGDLLTFQIYVPSSHQVIHRSVLRSADDRSTAGPPNLRALNPHYNNEDDEHEEMAELEIEIEEATNAAERQDGSGVIDSDDEISLGDISHIDRNDTLQTSRDLGPDDPRSTQAITDDDIEDPRELVGTVFITEHNGIEQRAEVTEVKSNGDDYLLEYADGSRQVVEYNTIIDKVNENLSEDDDNRAFAFKDILDQVSRRFFRMQYPNCEIPNRSDFTKIKDGICDRGSIDTYRCGFDGGDHCITFEIEFPGCNVAEPSWIGDGICNGGQYNSEPCSFDERDCDECNTMLSSLREKNIKQSLLGDADCNEGI